MTQQPLDNGNRLQPWWQAVNVELGQCWHYTVGPLSVYLQRESDQWHLCWQSVPESPDRYRIVSEAVKALPEDLVPNRYVFRDAPESFTLTPQLFERPLVVKTDKPVMIPPAENITFYISSPVLVKVALGTLESALKELPTVKLSDTWFGPNTREGELCYAAKTHARNSKEDVPLRPHRAVTPVTLHNRSEEMLAIEKLSIPLPFLSVYGQQDGTLWTDPVSLEHRAAGELATMKIGRKPANAVLLTSARTPAPKNNVVRAFINLFAD